MFKINLVPEVQQNKQKIAKRNTYATIFGIITISVTVAILLIIGSIRIGQTLSLNSTKDAIKVVEEESREYKELEDSVLSLEAGLLGAKQILNGQNSWTKLFPHLESATPQDVQFKSIEIDGETITAQLRGQSIDSLARFINSYKSYQVVTLEGTGKPGEVVSILVDNELEGPTTTVDIDGKWIQSIVVLPSTDHQIVVSKGNNERSLSYNSKLKTIEVHGSDVSAKVVNMFTNVNTTEYSKENNNVIFNATLNFASEALW